MKEKMNDFFFGCEWLGATERLPTLPFLYATYAYNILCWLLLLLFGVDIPCSTSSTDIKPSSNSYCSCTDHILHFNELHLVCTSMLLELHSSVCYNTEWRFAGASLNIAYGKYFGTVSADRCITGDCLTKMTARWGFTLPQIGSTWLSHAHKIYIEVQ